jgi:hypothetical protein
MDHPEKQDRHRPQTDEDPPEGVSASGGTGPALGQIISATGQAGPPCGPAWSTTPWADLNRLWGLQSRGHFPLCLCTSAAIVASVSPCLLTAALVPCRGGLLARPVKNLSNSSRQPRSTTTKTSKTSRSLQIGRRRYHRVGHLPRHGTAIDPSHDRARWPSIAVGNTPFSHVFDLTNSVKLGEACTQEEWSVLKTSCWSGLRSVLTTVA